MILFNALKKVLILVILSLSFTIVVYLSFTYFLEQPSIIAMEISPEEAYITVLQNFYNYTLSNTSNLNIEDIKDKFSSQYVMVKGNGSVYSLNEENEQITNRTGLTQSPTSGGTHYSWEITINNTKYYVDSKNGQIISHIRT